MRIMLTAGALGLATMASANTVTVTDASGHNRVIQSDGSQRMFVDTATGKTHTEAAPSLPTLKNHDNDKGTLIDVRKPASADAFFDLSKYMSSDPRPCGGVKSLSNWGKPPPDVAMYLAQCRNGQAYVIAQQLSTGKTRFAHAERVKH